MTDGISTGYFARRKAKRDFCCGVMALCSICIVIVTVANIVYHAAHRYPQSVAWFEIIGAALLVAAIAVSVINVFGRTLEK